jgi:hypothetical protein
LLIVIRGWVGSDRREMNGGFEAARGAGRLREKRLAE